MRKVFQLKAFIAVLLLSLLGTAAQAETMSAMPFFGARLNGAQEVPAVTTSALGVASLALSQDMKWATLSMHVNGLSGNIQDAHIHEGAMGANGNVALDLKPMINGNHISGRLDLSKLDMKKLLAGMYYINVHTTANANGEIRGQIMLEADKGFQGWLMGNQEVPSVTTNGYGLATVRLSQDLTKLHVHLRFRDLSSAVTGGHLHYGAKGKNGAVVVNLNLTALSTGADVVVDLSTVTNKAAFIDSLMAEKIYVNVHTVNNANGEIRTQLIPMRGLAFDAMLTGAQEVPAVATLADGIAAIWVSPGMDTIKYNAIFNGLSGAVTGAHFHMAESGANGPVVINLTGSVSNNKIDGMLTGSAVDMKFVMGMMKNHIYMNVHTANNPNGEIRGQVMKYARDGYAFLLNSGQEVPALSIAGAMGSGLVSIDRDRTNAHFMAVWSGLTGAVTGVHFHDGKPGATGSVIFNMNTYLLNDAAVYGYWNDGTFTQTVNNKFRNNSIYMNVHTPANANGEIRGNVISSEMLTGMPPLANPGFSGNIVLSARMEGGQEVPAVNTTSKGVAGFVLSDDMTAMTMNMTVANPASPTTGAHIHEGAKGANGAVIFDLDNFRNGNVVSGTVGTAELTKDDLLKKMMSGGTYVNFHNASFTDGEVRGQIGLEQDHSFTGMLSGQQEVPVVATNAYGLAVASLSLDKAHFRIDAIFQDLSSAITGAHLHAAKKGVNGSVVIDLGPYLQGNHIMAELDLSKVFPKGYDALMADSLYINVHTTNNPNGEIRAQLNMTKGITASAWMDAAQETGASLSAATGLGAFVLSPAMDELKYWVVMDNISGDIKGAHFHTGAAGTSGAVVVDLSDSVSKHMITGTAKGTDITKAFIRDMLKGNIYLNVHTAAFTDGELRGQLYTYLRDGYVFNLCGGQEVPEVADKGLGTAVVSLGRDLRNVHYMIVVDSLSGAITGAHFHKASKGVNGAVIREITTDFVNNAAYGFWSDSLSANPFSLDIARDIQAGQVYVNIHTAKNANGEIRGQVLNNLGCEISGIAKAGQNGIDMNVYPQPFHEQLNMKITAATAGNYTIKVYDMSGRSILQQAYRLNTGANVLNMNASGWNTGLYLLHITDTAGNTYTAKVVKD